MKPRQLLVYLAVFVLAGGFYYIYEVRLGAERKELKKAEARIYNLEFGQITGFIFKNGPQEYELIKRAAGEWEIVRPIRTPADRWQVEGMLSNLLKAEKDQVFDLQGGGLPEYGLDKPKLSLTLLGGDKEQKPLAPAFYLGGRSPMGQLYYARLGDSKQAFTVIAPLKQELDLELYDLRDKSLVLFDGDKIDGLKLAVQDKGEVELKRQAPGRWSLTGPKPAQADPDLMEKLVYLGLKGQVTGFLMGKETKQDYGFSKPLATVKVLHQGREAAEVLLGGPEYKKSDKDDGSDKTIIGYWARTTERPEVMLVSRKVADHLVLGYNELQDRHVLDFSRRRLTAVTAVRDKTLLKVKKVKDMWEVLEPASSVSQDRDIEKFLRALENLRYVKVLDSETATLSRYGLNKPDLRVELIGPDKKTAVLAMSFNSAEAGRLAVRAGDGPVLLVKQDDLIGALPREIAPAEKPVSSKIGSEADRAASKKK